MTSNLDLFLDDLASFIRLTSGREEGCTESFAEATLVKLDGYLRALYAVIGTIQYHYGSDPSSSDLLALGVMLRELADILEEIKSRWCDLEVGISLTSPSSMLRAERHYTGGRGRPKYVVGCEQLVFLRELRFTWTTIAQMYGISRRTLYNIRSHYNMTGAEFSAFTQISDEDLKHTIREIKLSLPECGQSMVRGILNSQGIYVPTTRIRECLAAVDPINTALRWATPITRRVYSVPHPNALWHLDGNHKLIRWRMVVHGGIDGYSRFIVFLTCNTNNKSETVFQLFEKAIHEYGVPDRIRTDKGGENIKVAEYMLLHGHVTNPMLTGSSVHNQRIERLWRDTFRCVLSLYYQVFHYLEGEGKLDPDSDIDLFCLHFVYIKKINEALRYFTDGWNSHAVTTESGMTPTQMFVAGALRSSLPISPDPSIPVLSNELDAPSVSVPFTRCPISAEQIGELETVVTPAVISCSDYGIEVYEAVRQFVFDKVSQSQPE